MQSLTSIPLDTTLTLIAGALGAAWAFFKGSEWFERLRRRRCAKALHVLEAAVDETYRTCVEAIKAARADGRLTPSERRRARELARQRAVALGRDQGLDILAELGREYLDLWIARIVKKLKRRAAPGT